MSPTSVARWVSISTAAGGGRREKLKLPRSKGDGTVRKVAPDDFRAPQRAGRDNPKVAGTRKVDEILGFSMVSYQNTMVCTIKRDVFVAKSHFASRLPVRKV